MMRIDGTKVADAKRKLAITITAKDVADGSVKEASSCAAARALCRQTGCTEARVHIARTYLKIGNRWVRYGTPAALRGEIIAFDRGGSFAPGDYILAPMQPTNTSAGRKKKRYPTTGVHPQKGQRSKPHVVTGIRAHGSSERRDKRAA